MNSSESAQLLRQAAHAASAHLVERETVAELMLLAAVAREHLLLIGPPGTGKSAVVRRVAQALGGRYFEYLIGRFTEPSELFGPIDLRRLREGVVETETGGMLPEAHVAFLDEVFLGSTAILNTLLGILNERRFRRGATAMDCPLRLCVAAANALPEDPMLAAFADRFLLHVFVEPVPDHALERLLSQGRMAELEAVPGGNMDAALESVISAARQMDLAPVRSDLAQAIRVLRKQGIALSDRRIVKAQQLIAAAAALAGRAAASTADLWPLVYVLPTAAAQASARETLAPWLAQALSHNLQHAAEHAAAQPLARMPRLLEQGAALLCAEPAAGALELQQWLKEVDVNFAEANRPSDLHALREQMRAALQRQYPDHTADAP